MSAQVPTYRRHKASGQAIVTLCHRDFYLGPFGTPESRAEYERRIGEWLALGRRLPDDVRPVQEPQAVTVAHLVDRFTDYARQRYGRDGRHDLGDRHGLARGAHAAAPLEAGRLGHDVARARRGTGGADLRQPREVALLEDDAHAWMGD